MHDGLNLEFACTHEPLAQLPDVALLTDVTVGCCNCLSELFRRYYHPVLTSALRILRDRTEAEDVAQEVFLSILQGRERYDPCRGPVKCWILTFAHFKGLRRRRYLRQRHFYALDEIQDIDEMRLHPKWKAYGMSSAEWTQYVEKGLDALNSCQRRTIELIHIDGYTLGEASQILEQGLSNTKNHYYRGMRILKEFLDAAERSAPEFGGEARSNLPAELALPLELQSTLGRTGSA